MALTDTALVIIQSVDGDDHFKIVEEHHLRPECTVKQTLLKTFSFQFVTLNKILHFATDTEEQCEFWLTSLSDAIKGCAPTTEPDNSSEVLYRESLNKISQDVYYDVYFPEKKPLVR